MTAQQLADRRDEYANVELWLLDNEELEIIVSTDDYAFTLEAHDGKEAMEMFRHPFAYRKVA